MIGYGSAAVNDQLIPVPVRAAYDPIMFGGAYTGISYPRNGVWNVPPVVPNGAVAGGGAGLAPSTPTTANPAPTAMSPSGNPLHPKYSPVLWALGFLVLALILLHKVHW